MRGKIPGSLLLGLSLCAGVARAETSAPAAQTPAATAPKPAAVATKPAPITEKVGLVTQKPAAVAGKPIMVVIGSTPCFWIRSNDGAVTPQQRGDRILDVFNKYLGGSKATFAVKPIGSKSGIFMNGDLTISVTPLDAKAAKAKSVTGLAATWKTLLAKAFNETKAVK